MEWRMLRLLNKDRKKYGLHALRMQEDLRKVARKHSFDMAKKDYFDHVNQKAQSPSDRLKIARITEVASGENLAKIGGYKNPTQKAEEGLMNSPGHRANILHAAYNAVGIGITRNSSMVYYFTQNFANRSLIFDNNPPSQISFNKTLKLKGMAFSDIQNIFCEMFLQRPLSQIHEFFIPLNNQRKFFSCEFYFSEPGLYTLKFYVKPSGKSYFVLVNSFEIKVKISFFQAFFKRL